MGALEGRALGTLEGAELGTFVGEGEGTSVGNDEGTCDGVADGDGVGICVGAALGPGDGGRDGDSVGAGEGVVKAPSEDTIDDSAVLRRLTLARLGFGRDLAASSANGQQPLKYRECILSVQCGWFAFFSSASDPRACAAERCRKSLATDARHLRAIYRFKRGMRRSTRSKERRGWCTSSRSRRGEKPARTGVHLCN